MMMMMMMQYTNCLVKADKVQTVKLTLYKYKSWWLCYVLHEKWVQFTICGL